MDNQPCQRETLAPKEQPTPEMPLSREECQKFMRAWHVTEAYSKGSDLYSWLFNAFQQWLPTHDATIRAQAVKEFALKLIATMPEEYEDGDDNDGVYRQLKACIAHIRAKGGIE